VETSLAARLLRERGAEVEAAREQFAKTPGPVEETEMVPPRREVEVARRLEELPRWRIFCRRSSQIIPNSWLFSSYPIHNSLITQESSGPGAQGSKNNLKCFWLLTRREMLAGAKTAFYRGPSETVLASIVWENVTVPGQPPQAMHRMTLVLARKCEGWTISLLQVTPIITR
jgi:hypothetical protein